MKPKKLSVGMVSLLVGLAVALVVPLIIGSNQYNMVLVTTVLLYGVLATAWNVIGGMGGKWTWPPGLIWDWELLPSAPCSSGGTSRPGSG